MKLKLIEAALNTSKELIREVGIIITHNKEMIEETDERSFTLACECIESYKKEISIIEEELKKDNLKKEEIDNYLNRISFINEKIREFTLEWKEKEETNKKIPLEENKAIILSAIGILTGGIGLVPYAITESKKRKDNT